MTFHQITYSVLLALRQLSRSTGLETLILPNHAGVSQHRHPADDEGPFSDEEELPPLPCQGHLLSLVFDQKIYGKNLSEATSCPLRHALQPSRSVQGFLWFVL